MMKARIALILDHPFYGTLALRLKMIADAEQSRGTASTDGTHLYYNPEWTEKLDKKEREGLIAHEVMHCALQHILRRQGRDPNLWNKACDYVINAQLKAQGFKLPEGGCFDDQYKDFTAEHTYNIMPIEPEDNQGGGSSPGWNFGGMSDALSDDASESQQAQAQQEWQIAVQQAANAAKMMGKMPMELERILSDVLDPVIDWKTMLYKYIHVPVKDDYNWARPNRRFLHAGIILPTLYSHAMGDVAVIVDTSGSIQQDELNQFAGEVSGVCEDAKPRKVHILYCDARVHRHDEFEASDYPITMDAVGGGGTDMEPAFAEIAKFDVQPECIIVLTDMYLNTDHIDIPECDTLWISTGITDTEVKFGEITKLNL